MSFTEVPMLDMALANDPGTKSKFLADMRHALMEVGFLYIKNFGIDEKILDNVIKEGRGFFEIPKEEKLKIEMKNARSFLGYSQLSAEITAGKIDHREQIDLSTEHPTPNPDAPLYENLLAPNQWPSSQVLPDFRPVFTEYMRLMAHMSVYFVSLVAEAIALPPTAFNKYFDWPASEQQHKLKIVKYPDVAELNLPVGVEGQGVGPHKDSMLTSFLLQASHHRGLQVQNMAGQWIDCPPINGTLVVAIGQGLEALTRGVCCSTTHRVLSPGSGEGARYSIPFFQGVRGGTTFEDLETVGIGYDIPEDVKEQRRKVLEANGGKRLDDCEFTFRSGGIAKTLGEATLRNRVKSHPDVGERWYPNILKEIREEQKREKVTTEASRSRDTEGTANGVSGGGQNEPLKAH